jgi:hypothetical protein
MIIFRSLFTHGISGSKYDVKLSVIVFMEIASIATVPNFSLANPSMSIIHIVPLVELWNNPFLCRQGF